MIDTAYLPIVNASLNTLSGAFLITGYRMVRARRIFAHRVCMGLAGLSSILFLTSYLVYHALHGSTRYTGAGFSRMLYFTILISHTILAVVILPFIIRTFYLALAGKDEKHRTLARRVFPVWLYVALTGVVIYLMLYWGRWHA